ncbi:D-alanyl-D-alanine carboxypeptidase family protein [Litorihabitans aurantiacus]|uniref:D-alanyl-D-alanine carboxypeptidase-like core domain-containing protein n=1 Tax=Litorihabitans aurantiacus TaxID=1930061 RepID=A0AA37UPD3_9MICO|nr:D-alanyl-D-alanine carboxypeptidase family protein [Litorihabitans aurantiacus]GMA30626.1 hypothetical protein GCM10025875_06180 [Litorihabitans aurantiacus]
MTPSSFRRRIAAVLVTGALGVVAVSTPATAATDAPGWSWDEGQAGVTYSSPYGTWLVPAPFVSAEHARTGGGRGAIGYPVGPQVSESPRYWYQRFERGVVHAGPRGTYTVHAPYVAAEHARSGGGGGVLGYPVTSQIRQGARHWYQDFERGGIYAGPSGTYSVSGAIDAKYRSWGGGTGVLGYPAGPAASDGPGYSYQRFERGVIYSGRHGTFVVDDDSIRRLHGERGGGTGGLGYPTSDTYGVGQRYQHFERGTAYGAGPQLGVTSLTKIQDVLIANKSYALPQDYDPGPSGVAWGAFETMRAEAARSGLTLRIVSGYRSFSYQAGLYDRYVRQHGQAAADRFSARPGHSEHQTGLAMDVNSTSGSFGSTPEGRWVRDNAHRFGFVVRYPEGKEHITGYMYEPWHLRHLGVDLATSLHTRGLTLEEHLGITSRY